MAPGRTEAACATATGLVEACGGGFGGASRGDGGSGYSGGCNSGGGGQLSLASAATDALSAAATTCHGGGAATGADTRPSCVTEGVIQKATNKCLGNHIPGPVTGSRSDPTAEKFNHGGIRVKLEERTAHGIPISNTVEQQRKEFKDNGFTIVDGNPFVDEAVERVVRIHGNRLRTMFEIDCSSRLKDKSGAVLYDDVEELVEGYLASQEMKDIFGRQPDPWLYAQSNRHITTPTTEEWRVLVRGERGELKREDWEHPEGSKQDLVLGYYVATELSDVSREHLSEIVEPFTGTMGSPSFYMSSALHSDSGAEGTRFRKSLQTLGQMLHADHAATQAQSAAGALGMVNGPGQEKSKKRKRSSGHSTQTAGPDRPARVGSVGMVQKSAPAVRWAINFTDTHRASVSKWFVHSAEGKRLSKEMNVPPGTSKDLKFELLWDLVVAEALLEADLEPWRLIELELARNEWILFDTDLLHFGAPYPVCGSFRGRHFRLHHYIMHHDPRLSNTQLPSSQTVGMWEPPLRPLRRMLLL